MLIVHKSYYNNYNVEDKEVLKSLLKRYEGTLNKSTLEYLNGLIELEFSVIKDNISSTKKENLIELELYRRIAIYNIYNRVLNLLRSHDELDIHNSNSSGYEGIYVSKKLDNDSIVELFNFNYDINRNRIGEMEFFETKEETKETRKEKINYAKSEIERIRLEIDDIKDNDIKLDKKRIIEYYIKMIISLEKKELTDIDKKKIEISKYYLDLLLDEFGLTKEDLKDEKVLVKRMPRLTIKDNIRYL